MRHQNSRSALQTDLVVSCVSCVLSDGSGGYSYYYPLELLLIAIVNITTMIFTIVITIIIG